MLLQSDYSGLENGQLELLHRMSLRVVDSSRLMIFISVFRLEIHSVPVRI